MFQIPLACISRQFRFHDHHVQRPSDFHRQPEARLVIFISQIKIAHPAHVTRGKACVIGEIRLHKLCGCDRSALLRTLADDLANGIDFIHLRKILRENCSQFPIHCAVIYRFSDVHGFSFPRWCASFFVVPLKRRFDLAKGASLQFPKPKPAFRSMHSKSGFCSSFYCNGSISELI